jgi:hypothetical protein
LKGEKMTSYQIFKYRDKVFYLTIFSLIIVILLSSPIYAQQARISVVSNPPGAGVYVGAKSIDRIIRYETGRYVGRTPLTTTITNADISMEGQNRSIANIHVDVRKKGYLSHDFTIGLGEYGRLESGKTYKVDVNLRRQ